MIHYALVLVGFTFVGFLAGVIDTLSGGGGLITVPTLLAMGLPPALALGTNKFQACIGEVNASYHFIRKKRVNINDIIPGIIFTAIGITFGALLIQNLHETISGKIIPILLLVVLVDTIQANSPKR